MDNELAAAGRDRAADDADASSAHPAPRHRLRRAVPDLVAVVALLCLIPVVHNVPSMLAQPYWLDEAWVALSTRASLADLPSISSLTPLGWSVLLRLIPDPDRLRILTLIFDGLTVGAGYAFGRALRWPSAAQARLAGLACAGAVLLLPAQQIRHDLKQYTADAAVTIGLLALAAWAESAWSRRRLAVIVIVATLGQLVSHVAAIASLAVFGGLTLASAVRRLWRRSAEAVVAGGLAGVIVAAIEWTLSTGSRSPGLLTYWAPYFPSPADLLGYLGRRTAELLPYLGVPPIGLLVLLGCGLMTIGRHSSGAPLIAVILLPVIAIVLGATRVYPLLDLRTSHFLLVTVAAVAGIGVAGVAVALSGRLQYSPYRTPIAAMLTLAAIGVYAATNAGWYRFTGEAPAVPIVAAMVTEDVRSATWYVRAHRAPQDVILLSTQARYGVAFYWNDAPLRTVPYPNTLGWAPVMPVDATFVVVADRSPDAIAAGVREAESIARRNGRTARVWPIRTHWTSEAAAWASALAGQPVQLVTSGVEPLAVIAPR